jgi:hypothetical protein
VNKDKLIKLIKLANNNPNDHEANLAARRVCQALAEDKFAALNSSVISHSNPSSQVADDWMNMVRNMRYSSTPYESKWRKHASNYNYGYQHVDQTDEPAVNASKEEWEEYYHNKREKKKQAKKYAGHAWCTECKEYTSKFDPFIVMWFCKCGKTAISEVDRARNA